MKHLKTTFIILMLLLGIVHSVNAQRYLGGDISLLPTYEQQGTLYRDSSGIAKLFFDFVKTDGKWNSARVRLFVNPANASQQAHEEGVLQSLDYIIPLCEEIKKAGMSLMLDFHYSDTWADPSHQTTPKAWANVSKKALADTIYNYTRHSLLVLQANGIIPDMIQVGNEITFGMDWPNGKVDPLKDDNWDTLCDYLKAGVKACREVCPQAKLIIHTEHAQDWKSTFGYYDKLRKHDVDYDIIGLSYYPMWHGSVGHLGVVLDSLEANFPKKDIMIVETAAYYSHDNDRWATKDQYSEFYPINKEGQREFTAELVSLLNRHHKVKGLYWWFPEENESGKRVITSWINRGLFDNHTGKALPAFYELRNFKTETHKGNRTLWKKSRANSVSNSTLIIWYDKGSKRTLLRAIRNYGAEIIYDYNNFNGIAVKIPQGVGINQAITYFQGVKGVLQVSRDRIMHLD